MAIRFEGEHSAFSIGLEAICSALLTTFQKGWRRVRIWSDVRAIAETNWADHHYSDRPSAIVDDIILLRHQFR